MKTIMQMRQISEQDLPDIYCDMDQVLCNFMKGADAAVGGSFVNTDKDERWNKISQTKNFWSNLEWMPGAKSMYQFIEKYDPYILSAASGRDPNSRTGKLKWLAKNTNFPKSRIYLVMRSQKQKYATTNGKPNILIDDYIKNIKEWENKGGIGIRHTDPRKTINELKRLGFK